MHSCSILSSSCTSVVRWLSSQAQQSVSNSDPAIALSQTHLQLSSASVVDQLQMTSSDVKVTLPAQVHGNPLTFSIDGKQYMLTNAGDYKLVEFAEGMTSRSFNGQFRYLRYSVVFLCSVYMYMCFSMKCIDIQQLLDPCNAIF